VAGSGSGDRAWQRLAWPLLAIAPSLWLMAPLMTGLMPVSHDHPVHLFKAWQYWEHFLCQGRLSGWSHLWFFGYPVGELYPPGPDLWVAGFRALTLAQLSWEHTYGLAFSAAISFFAFAHYRLGAAFFGPAVGVGAAWLAVLDLGARREGGWVYTVEFGVWGQPLAMAFSFLGWAHLHRLLQSGARREAIWATLWLALAFLTHPTTIILLAAALPIYLVAKGWGEGRFRIRDLRDAAGVTAVAAALAGFWLLPFVARSGLTLDIGTTWKSLAEVARDALGGHLFQNVWPVWTWLGLGACAFALWRRSWLPAFLGVTSLSLVVFGTTDVSAALGGIHEVFSRIQFQRMAIPARAFWHVLVVWAALELWRRARAHPIRVLPGHPAVARALNAALLGVMVALATTLLGSDLVAAHVRSRALPRHAETAWWADFQDFTRWSRKQGDASPEFFRIAYWLPSDDHRLMAAPVYNGLPYYKIGYTPAKLFGLITRSADPQVLEQLSVRYLVTMASEELAGLKIPQAARFGEIRVYELPGWRKSRHHLLGEGSVEELEFGDERLVLQLDGPSAGSRLVLHVADHPRWEARIEGNLVPIERVRSADPGGKPILISVPAAEGTVEIRWRARAVDRAGLGLTLAGLAALLVQAWRSTRPRSADPTRPA